MKSGYQTSEFWMTIVNAILWILVAFGLVQQEEADTLSSLIAPVVAAVIPLIVYIFGRNWLKRNQSVG